MTVLEVLLVLVGLGAYVAGAVIVLATLVRVLRDAMRDDGRP